MTSLVGGPIIDGVTQNNSEGFFEVYNRYADDGGVLDQFAETYNVFNRSNQSDFNAAAHALTSAGLTFHFGGFIADNAGLIREITTPVPAGSTEHQHLLDSNRDVFNNRVGIQIAEYAIDNNLPEAALGLLVDDALSRGLLIVNEFNDPRMESALLLNQASWNGPSQEALSQLIDEFNIDSSQSLETGNNTGPGTRAPSLIPDNPGIPQPKPSILDIIPEENHCFLAGTPIDMWPLDPDFKPDANGNYDEKEVLAKVWQKPIEQITENDIVVSPDKDGRLKPGRVSQTFQNRSKHILDLFGLMTTPGHAFFCAEGKFKGQHVPIMDILRSDGCIQNADGTIIRAATNCEIGSLGDRMIKATACIQKPDGTFTEKKRGEARFGTRIFLPDGRDMSFMEMALTHGWKVSEDGFMLANFKNDDGTVEEQKFYFPYTYGEDFPKPEDYVMLRSQVTTQDIYQHGEWEAAFPPRMPAPYAGEAGASYKPNPTLQASAPPNIPLSMRNSPNQPTMTRKQRRAYEAKQRKAAKANRTARVAVH